MKIKSILFSTYLPLCIALFVSCSAMIPPVGTGRSMRVVTEGTVKGQFRVQLIECIGNTSSQSVTAILAVTNTGPNTHFYIGGSSNGSMAVDSYGSTVKPYNSAGKHYDLPSGVVVRVEIDRIEPVRPGTPGFQTLRVSLGVGDNNIIDFRNIPIIWMD